MTAPHQRKNCIGRRDFLKGAVAAAAVPWMVPSGILGGEGQTAPSQRITVGLIGHGAMGRGHLSRLAGDPAVQVLAVCDVHRLRREEAQRRVEETYSEGARRRHVPRLRPLQRLPRAARSIRYRRGCDRHARPLARAAGDRRGEGRQRHLLRETCLRNDPRRPRAGQGGAPIWAGVPDRHAVPLDPRHTNRLRIRPGRRARQDQIGFHALAELGGDRRTASTLRQGDQCRKDCRLLCARESLSAGGAGAGRVGLELVGGAGSVAAVPSTLPHQPVSRRGALVFCR